MSTLTDAYYSTENRKLFLEGIKNSTTLKWTVSEPEDIKAASPRSSVYRLRTFVKVDDGGNKNFLGKLSERAEKGGEWIDSLGVLEYDVEPDVEKVLGDLLKKCQEVSLLPIFTVKFLCIVCLTDEVARAESR